MEKRIYSFWIDGDLWRNYLTKKECDDYLKLAPKGEVKPLVR